MLASVHVQYLLVVHNPTPRLCIFNFHVNVGGGADNITHNMLLLPSFPPFFVNYLLSFLK